MTTNVSGQVAAMKYLHQPLESFWSWTGDGGAIQWADNSTRSTIVFTAELLTVLRHQFADGARGLPPLEAVILLVAATRENWSDSETTAFEGGRHPRYMQISNGQIPLLKEVLVGLDKVHELDNDVRLNLEAKKWLAELVFRESTRTTVDTAKEVLQLLGGIEETFWSEDKFGFLDNAEETLSKGLYALYHGLNQVTSERLRSLRETGIEEFPVAPEETELEFPEHDSIKSLVQALHSDQEMYGLARAAQQLMSVMSLPRPMLQDDQLEQGGFSDIANRGSLDRLLLTELAYDDLTLAVRVAVNEAMYLRRESPPSNSPRRRVILLDSGLRMWGVPRFLGTSVALALAGQVQSDAEPDANPFTTYSVNGSELQEIDLGRRKGISEHLKTLRPELDPSQSLGAFAKSLGGFEEDPEVVVVTSPEALSDVKFRDNVANLAQENPGSYFVATVARDGETRLHEITRSGCKLLQQMRFDLEKVFANPPISNNRPASKLPAIFGVEPFPLLLSYHYKKPSRAWSLGTEMILAITRDSRLMLSLGSSNGAVQLKQHIKPADHWWSSRAPVDSIWYSIIGNAQRNDFRLLSFNEKDLAVEETTLELKERPEAFCSHGESIFVIGKKHVSMIDRTTGMTSLNQLEIEDKMHQAGRFFTSANAFPRRWYALGNSGLAPAFELLPSATNDGRQIVAVFDSEAVEGPVGVINPGKLFFFSTDKMVSPAHRLGDWVAVNEISSTGNEIIFADANSELKARVDVKTGELLKPPGHLSNFREMQERRLVGQHQLRTRFIGVGIRDGKILSLVSRKQSRIDVRFVNNEVRLVPEQATGATHSNVRFEVDGKDASFAFKLQVARWKDGSEAWLDSRGLLHLKSSDNDIPELTMTLSDGVSGGWMSNGRVWGNPFFLNKHRLVHATREHAMDIITQFTTNITRRC